MSNTVLYTGDFYGGNLYKQEILQKGAAANSEVVSCIFISFDINNTATEEQILNKWFLVKEEVTANMISYFRQIFNETVVQLPVSKESGVSVFCAHSHKTASFDTIQI
jgi:hypothetical protein